MKEIKTLKKTWRKAKMAIILVAMLIIMLIFATSSTYPIIQVFSILMIIIIVPMVNMLLLKPFFKIRMEALVDSYLVALNSKNPCSSYVYFPPYKDMEPFGKYVKDKEGEITFIKF